MKSKFNEERCIKLYNDGKTDAEIGKELNCSPRTIERWLRKYRNEGKIPYRVNLEVNIDLERQKQKNRDLGRIDRRKLRDSLRVGTAIAEYSKELIKVFDKYDLSTVVKQNKSKDLNGDSIGLFHITDPHFNELVDLDCNKYDFTIASKRYKKYVDQAKKFFKVAKVKKILIAMTGDLLNSDRRLDELLSEATNRSKATFIAVSILEQVILDLAKDFEITVVNVIGNESRIPKDFGWTEAVASDNYDYTIYHILKRIFRNTNITFVSGNSLEQVVEINGMNVLFFHGNQVAGQAEGKVQSIKGKYTARNITIHFAVFGDKHSARIGDTYARGSSVVGANGYSDSALQLEGRASQNIHIFYKNGNRDSIKIDLQNVDGVEGYPIIKELEEYNAKSVSKARKKTTIVRIVV